MCLKSQTGICLYWLAQNKNIVTNFGNTNIAKIVAFHQQQTTT